MTTREKITKLFNEHEDWSVSQLTNKLNVSKQLVHRILKDFVTDGYLKKVGLPPHTIYRRNTTQNQFTSEAPLQEYEKEYLKKHFLLISETGEFLEGYDGFQIWCKKRKLPLEKTLDEFIQTRLKYENYFEPNGLINGTNKLLNTTGFSKIYLDNLYYLDFYAIERFGKTRLGTLLHFAKQGQNKYLMRIIVDEIKQRTNDIISELKIDALGFVPPTIPRQVQIMDFIRYNLEINLPEINIKKISGLIPVPQKSLQKIEERINNADATFTLSEIKKFKNVLLIDDAVGSGATLNQISKKIITNNIALSVTGLAIVGSFKGFDVITDV